MTLIRVGIVRTGDGDFVPSEGFVGFKPFKRYVTETDPNEVVVPSRLDVPVGFEVELPPGAYKCVERVPAGITRFVVVPDSGTHDYADLPSIDPKTLEPREADIPAWQEAVNATNAARKHVDDIGLLIHGVAETAQSSAVQAEGYMAVAASHAGTAVNAAARVEAARGVVVAAVPIVQGYKDSAEAAAALAELAAERAEKASEKDVDYDLILGRVEPLVEDAVAAGLSGVDDLVASALVPYATTSSLSEGLATKQDAGDYALVSQLPDTSGLATTAALTSGLAEKQPVGDYATRDDLGDYATTAYVDQTVGNIDTALAGILGGE